MCIDCYYSDIGIGWNNTITSWPIEKLCGSIPTPPRTAEGGDIRDGPNKVVIVSSYK